jgi:hypothetical protein
MSIYLIDNRMYSPDILMLPFLESRSISMAAAVAREIERDLYESYILAG